MIFLPIVDRELQSASRRKSTYTMRIVAVILALGVALYGLGQFAGSPMVSTSIKGQRLFEGISMIAFLYCLLMGVPVASDNLSREKREDTLGFLFLTNLKSHDVVLGKLAGTSINAVYCLIAIFPVLALPMQMGGVPLGRVILVSVILLNTIFLSLSAGLFVSAISRSERRAMFAAFLMIAMLALGPFILSFAVMDDRKMQLYVASLSPAFFLSEDILSNSRIGTSVWVSLVFNNLLGWLMLIWSIRILNRVWHEQAKKSWLQRILEVLDRIGYGNSAQRRVHRRRLLNGNPYVWLASRDRWKVRYVWILAASCIAVWLYSYFRYGYIAFDEGMVFTIVFLLNAFLKVWVASEVCQRIIDDRRAGALELLLSTPMSGRDYLAGVARAVARQFGPPLLVIAALQFVLLLKTFEPVIAPLYILMLPLDAITMAVVGMVFGLTCKNSIRSLLGTVAVVCGTPYFLFFLASPFLFPDRNGATVMGHSPAVAFAYVWFFLGLFTDLFVGYHWGLRRLLEYSRSAARFYSVASLEKGR